jgi:CheY-like chemotaxis protein
VAKTLIREEVGHGPAGILDGKRALIVDDGTLAREILAGWNMQVTTVDDGLSALIAIDEAANLDRPFDVILIDQPGETGCDMAHAIRRLETGCAIKLILCAASGPDAVAIPRAPLQCDAVVLKPLAREAVLEALTLALASPMELEVGLSAARTLIANHACELDAMRSDLWSGDRYTLRRRAQVLQDAARAIGAVRLLEIATLLETEAATMGQAEAFAQIERLARLFAEAAGDLLGESVVG